MSGATRIDSATNGLSVTVGDDGAWVEFTTQTGKHFCFQPAQEFCGHGGIGADVVRDWCLEMQARRTTPKPEDSTLGAAPQLSATPLADLTLVLAGVVEQRDGLRTALEGAAAALMMAAAGEIDRDGVVAAWNDCGAALAKAEGQS